VPSSDTVFRLPAICAASESAEKMNAKRIGRMTDKITLSGSELYTYGSYTFHSKFLRAVQNARQEKV
jgi:hypothetical protein